MRRSPHERPSEKPPPPSEIQDISNLATALNTCEEVEAQERANGNATARVQAELPKVSAFYSFGFNWYVRRYLRRHFNAVRVAKQTAPALPADQAVICFANHPAWWDPLMAFLMNQLYFSGRTVYAPIDLEVLKQYPVFRKLGFYGIDMQSLEGAKRFLSTTRELLKQPKTAIWMTPGGKFADARARTTFEPGLPHVAASTSGVTLVPMALEYPFWEERTPEALAEFGAPFRADDGEKSKEEWQRELEDRLAAAQASLAEKAICATPRSSIWSWMARRVSVFGTTCLGGSGRC